MHGQCCSFSKCKSISCQLSMLSSLFLTECTEHAQSTIYAFCTLQHLGKRQEIDVYWGCIGLHSPPFVLRIPLGFLIIVDPVGQAIKTQQQTAVFGNLAQKNHQPSTSISAHLRIFPFIFNMKFTHALKSMLKFFARFHKTSVANKAMVLPAELKFFFSINNFMHLNWA